MQYKIEWVDIRSVMCLVKGKSKKDAIKNLIAGNSNEIDWSGSSSPDNESDIIEIEKISKKKYDELMKHDRKESKF